MMDDRGHDGGGDPKCGGSTQSWLHNPQALAIFMNKMDRSLQCAICLDFLSNPSQLPCGHHYCRHCITKALETKAQCPLCKESFRKRQLKATGLFNALSGLVQSFPRDIIPEQRVVDTSTSTTTTTTTTASCQNDDGSGSRSHSHSHSPSDHCWDSRAESSTRVVTQESVELLADMFGPGDLIEVAARTGPGMNKPGGIGTVKKVDLERHCLDVKYVLGGMDKNVPFNICARNDVYRDRQRRTPNKGRGGSRGRRAEAPRSPSYSQKEPPPNPSRTRKRRRAQAPPNVSSAPAELLSNVIVTAAPRAKKTDAAAKKRYLGSQETAAKKRPPALGSQTAQSSQRGSLSSQESAPKVKCQPGARVRMFCSNVSASVQEAMRRLVKETPTSAVEFLTNSQDIAERGTHLITGTELCTSPPHQ